MSLSGTIGGAPIASIAISGDDVTALRDTGEGYTLKGRGSQRALNGKSSRFSLEGAGSLRPLIEGQSSRRALIARNAGTSLTI